MSNNLRILINVIFVIAFLTINFEVLPFGEYQPLLLLTIGIILIVLRGKVGKYQLLCSVLMLSVGGVSTLISNTGSPTDVLRICIAGIFLVSGSLIIVTINKKIIYAIVVCHMVVLILGSIFPKVTSGFLAIFFPRGVSYYDGYNAFFAPEPSYASINYFGVYLIYRLISFLDGSYRHSNLLEWCFIFPLLLTKSITGFGFAVIMILFNILENRDLILRNLKKIAVAGFFFISCSLLIADKDILINSIMGSFSRVLVFLNFITGVDESTSLLLWTIAEPASAARFIANMSALFEGITSLTGNGKFSLNGPDHSYYPTWLEKIFTSSPIIDVGINAQTPLFNLIGHSGWLSILPILTIAHFFRLGLKEIDSKSTKFLILVYVLIGMLWQSAFVAPIIWIVISAVIGMKTLRAGVDLTK